MIQSFVAGLLFSYNRDRILLIRKRKNIPNLEWMGGKLNAIGGKINQGETPLQAMHREFDEETGLEVDPWRPFLNLSVDKGGVVYFYRAFTKDFPLQDQLIQKTDEHIGVYHTYKLNKTDILVSNLLWIIPMALDADVLTSTTYSK